MCDRRNHCSRYRSIDFGFRAFIADVRGFKLLPKWLLAAEDRLQPLKENAKHRHDGIAA
jgi:hypothetical protein